MATDLMKSVLRTEIGGKIFCYSLSFWRNTLILLTPTIFSYAPITGARKAILSRKKRKKSNVPGKTKKAQGFVR